MYEAIKTFASTTCQQHEAMELPSEMEVRTQRAKRKNPDDPSDTGRHMVEYNVINTFKFHSLGDHTEYIRRSGPTDNTTTQIGEQEHKHVKHEHARTNKVNFEMQIAENVRNTDALASLRPYDEFVAPSLQKELDKREAIARAEAHERSGTSPLARAATGERVVPMSPSDHYRISRSQRNPMPLREWTAQNESDPAVKGFIPHLYEHLAARLIGGDMFTEPNEFTPEQLDGVQILDDKMYPHNLLRLNYTTYDLRREQDCISPHKQADIMVLAPEWDNTPFWFARVIGIFHVNTRYVGPGSTHATKKWQRIDFLWPRVQFVDAHEPDNVPFSFVDPDDVIRAAYLLPCPREGLTHELLGPSKLARKLPIADEVLEEQDYAFFEVSMFADRDIFMRHHGGGIGHKGIGVDVDTSRQHRFRRLRFAEANGGDSDSDYEDYIDEILGYRRPTATVRDSPASCTIINYLYLHVFPTLDEALQALLSDEDDEDPAEVLLADPNEDDTIEWGDLFGDMSGGEDSDHDLAPTAEENDQGEEEEEDDLYANYAPL
ncbi:hypothetical protein L227DRAFT_566740 [Lentinus tigrinus ALCF2SS1-6]|uniref:Uncharacterized protein n=1 Tax=Lentinus tigrinus ALCF2SS1-6 TaxID=1328759 RepID=A0A5C2RWU8_9APHY|nr:hypothetical protein L227DRAFT_566740 [Lentinus tigrinus ALCF2SS1-6]